MPLLMGMMKRFRDLDAKFGDFATCELLTASPVAKSYAADKIADDVHGVAVSADLVNMDNVGVTQLSGGPGLAEKLLGLGGVHVPPTRKLDGYRAIELFVSGLPDASKTAHAQSLHQLEAAQLGERIGAAR